MERDAPAPPGPSRRPRRERAVEAAIAGAAAIAVLASGAGLGWLIAHPHAGEIATPAGRPAAVHLAPQPPSSTRPGPLPAGASAAASRVTPAIVDIEVTLASGGSAAGTGMVLSPAGEVLTNNHVVKGASAIRVTIAGRSDWHAATVLGVDVSADVALVRVTGVSGWPSVTLADSSTLSIGQPVIAIGNALGRGGAPSVTAGHITGLGRSITAGDAGGASENLSGLIETDASISPGDSGGALANTAGQVVGMITAGETAGRRQLTSIAGFAVPSGTAGAIVARIRSGETGSGVVRTWPAYLGVRVTSLDAGTGARLGVNEGVLVMGVTAGSPAAAAGIGAGAVITRVGAGAVVGPEALGVAIRAHAPGDRVDVSWVDRAGAHTRGVTLVEGPPV